MNENESEWVANKYKILTHLGSGAFGNVYKGIYVKKDTIVALKFEDKATKYNMIKHETTLLKYLYDHGCRGVPVVYWYGSYRQSVCLVMGYYDCSLSDYIKVKSLSINKLNNILIQYIRIIESIHSNYVIHRDIKPQNCMIKSGEMFLIDFGLATFYTNEDKTHVYADNPIETIVGSPRYISFNIHNACMPTRRDDLISLGYIYIYLYAKALPWDEINQNEENGENGEEAQERLSELYVMNFRNQQRKLMKSWHSIQPISLNIGQTIRTIYGVLLSINNHNSTQL